VGPISAGSIPGPACYGNGGSKATVSDANLILGRLPEVLVAGKMKLNRDMAEQAIKPFAEEMEVSLEAAADGIIRVVNSNMVRALQAVSVERGFDPREFVLMPFGGAGGLHSSALARIMGISEILVPLSPGILCAQGLIATELTEIFVTTRRAAIDDTWGDGPIEAIGELLNKAAIWFQEGNILGDCQTISTQIEMRYIGQNYELPIDVPGMTDNNISLPSTATLLASFHDTHERSYGYSDPTMAVEMVNLRVTAKGKLFESGTQSNQTINRDGPLKPKSQRQVWYTPEGAVETPIFDRGDLMPGDKFSGPAIVEQLDATTVMFPGDAARVDNALNIKISVSA
jgi:N-methylhydantoinase A